MAGIQGAGSVSILQPKFFVFENVPGILTAREGEESGYSRFRRDLRSLAPKFETKVFKIDASRVGVPQKRNRVFIIGSSYKSDELGHIAAELAASPVRRTTWDALGRMKDTKGPPMTGRWADLLPTIPEGENYQFHTHRGGGEPLFGYRTRYWSFLMKLAKSEPSWTLPATYASGNGPFHWNNRRLSADEAAALQCLPQGVLGNLPYIDAMRLIGNAVPPLLAERVAKAVATALLGVQYRGEFEHLIPSLGDPPRPETPRPLNSGEWKRLKDEVSHPGTGKGPRAQSKWPSKAAS